MKANAQMLRARAFLDALTVNAPDADPTVIVPDPDKFFAWDNEHRSKKNGKAFLYDWSYYIGVVMEGLYYLYEAGEGENYRDYVLSYLHAVETDGALNEFAGYVPDHGLDCYKTASLLPFFFNDPELKALADRLYDDLVHVNECYSEQCLGFNYWHCWDHGNPPVYKVWLDGLYMGQVFLARYAESAGDTKELAKIAGRFKWINENLKNPETGLLYHAGNGKDSVCPFHWLRACGWYAMAQVDVLECLPECGMKEELKKDFEVFCADMLRYQTASGLWLNVIDDAEGSGNRAESSGTAMMAYTMLKGARLGLIDQKYSDAGEKAFCALTDLKLNGNALTDVYLMASASGEDNYHDEDYYMPQEGKGVGPYIMAYAEMVKK